MEFTRFVPFWQTKRNIQIHQKKLKNIQPVMHTLNNNFSPLKQRHHSNNQHVYNHRNFEIQLQNKALLAKLTKNNLLSKRKENYENNLSQLDASNCDKKSLGENFSGNKTRLKNKMNKKQYFEEFERQNRNRDLLKKLKNIKTNYSAKVLAQDYTQKSRIMNLICRFPLKGMKPTRTFLKLDLKTATTHDNKRSNSKQKQQSTPRRKTLLSQIEHRRNISKGNRNQNRQVCNTQRRLSEKITKIYKIRKLYFQDNQVFVKGIQYKNYLKLQLILDDVSYEICISIQDFIHIYKSNYYQLVSSIGYNSQMEDFYLK